MGQLTRRRRRSRPLLGLAADRGREQGLAMLGRTALFAQRGEPRGEGARAARIHTRMRPVPPPRVRELGIRSGFERPSSSTAHLWDAAVVGMSRPEPLPPTPRRAARTFADFVAAAIANAETGAQLTASRARIVAPGALSNATCRRAPNSRSQPHQACARRRR
jgi:hypothetical protein